MTNWIVTFNNIPYGMVDSYEPMRDKGFEFDFTPKSLIEQENEKLQLIKPFIKNRWSDIFC